MTLEDAQELPPVTPITPPTRNEFTTKLVEQSNNTAYNNLAKLISLSEYTDDTGTTFRARMLTHKEIGKLKKLQKEEDKIDQDEKWDDYIVNLKQQAKLLIKDFTDELFDNADFYILENLIVAWRMKPRGFRSL